MRAPAAQLDEKLGVHLDPELLVLALTHRSFAHEAGGIPTNERLEFLGDTVLGLVVTEALYRRHPSRPRASSRRCVPRRCPSAPSRASRGTLDLGSYVLLGKGELSTGGRDKDSILVRHARGVFGAVYLTHGLESPARSSSASSGHAARRRRTSVRAWTGRRPSRSCRPPLELGAPSTVERSRTGPLPDVHRADRRRRVRGEATGPAKKLAEQEAAADAYRAARTRGRAHRRRRGRRSGGRPVAPDGAAACPSVVVTSMATVPELPEVETVRDGLARHVLGQRVAGVEVRRARRYAARRAGRGVRRPPRRPTLAAVVRRGKFLWLVLDDGERGGPARSPRDERPAPRPSAAARRGDDAPEWTTRTCVRASHLDERLRLDFVDQRTFGALGVTDLVPRRTAHPPGTARPGRPAGARAHIARDLLDPHVDRRSLVAALRRDGRTSNERCSTRRWCRAWATSTRTRRCGGPACTERADGGAARSRSPGSSTPPRP